MSIMAHFNALKKTITTKWHHEIKPNIVPVTIMWQLYLVYNFLSVIIYMKNPSCLSSLYMCWESFRYLLWNGVLLLSCNVFFISWSNMMSPLKLNYHKQLGCSFLCEQTYKFTRSSWLYHCTNIHFLHRLMLFLCGFPHQVLLFCMGPIWTSHHVGCKNKKALGFWLRLVLSVLMYRLSVHTYHKKILQWLSSLSQPLERDCEKVLWQWSKRPLQQVSVWKGLQPSPLQRAGWIPDTAG